LELIQYFSIPEVIYSDSGPQIIKDREFDKFCHKWGIHNIGLSPDMPHSNFIAAFSIKEMKKLILTNLSSNGVLNKVSAMSGLKMFHNTPHSGTGESTAQLTFGRNI
jgi:hypothetical protein